MKQYKGYYTVSVICRAENISEAGHKMFEFLKALQKKYGITNDVQIVCVLTEGVDEQG